MKATRIQGMAFVALATVITASTIVLDRLPERTQLLALAALIVILGVPHGALDTIFARHLYNIGTTKKWLLFALAYIIPVLFVIAIWHLAPGLFLLGFLLISLVHFSGDPAAGTPHGVRIVYGGLIIFLPMLRHTEAVVRLFSFLAGNAAPGLGFWIHLLSWPWLLAALVAIVVCCKRSDWLTALEIAAVAILATFAPPLVAFTVFFCGMHSARHILRTIDYSGQASPRMLLAACLGPMFGVALLAGAATLWLRNVPIEARLIQLVFVGLAALTVPHMGLVERVRFSGWLPATLP
jgi:Brp/Blh family beta-carotene 15,15'-monooxygenase